MQYSIDRNCIFQFHLRFLQNIVQTLKHGHITKLACRKITPANRFIREAVIIVWINPLFAGRWKYGHAHFRRFEVVFATKSSRKKPFERVELHFSEKVGSTGVLSGKTQCLLGWRAPTRPPFQYIVTLQRRARWSCFRADVFKDCMSFKWPIKCPR